MLIQYHLTGKREAPFQNGTHTRTGMQLMPNYRGPGGSKYVLIKAGSFRRKMGKIQTDTCTLGKHALMGVTPCWFAVGAQKMERLNQEN